MEELRVRVRTEELKVTGSAEVIQREREAFYQHIKESEEANIKARIELAQRMKNDMAWYARMWQEKDAANAVLQVLMANDTYKKIGDNIACIADRPQE